VLAITDRPEQSLPEGEGLEQVSQAGIAGVFTRAHERAGAGAEELWRHEQLVERLMEDRAVLPLRYGTTLREESELERVLEERADEFRGLLDQVRGRVELALRVMAADGDEPEQPASSGRAYMETLARRRRSADAAVAALEPLERVAEAAVKREKAGDLTRLAFLVDRDGVEAFNARLDELRGEHPELQVTCTGPWPPYSFVSGGP
jgi:hypothetical protein